MDKNQMVQNVLKEREEEAERFFKSQVESCIKEISEYSHRLENAKKRFRELKYEPPAELNLD